ncbi:hypothetical protein QP028_01065 [Corynebacterium suedekumii]|nr:hypothetical protein QP028_01065 [Corynebacterium suedekumii]
MDGADERRRQRVPGDEGAGVQRHRRGGLGAFGGEGHRVEAHVAEPDEESVEGLRVGARGFHPDAHASGPGAADLAGPVHVLGCGGRGVGEHPGEDLHQRDVLVGDGPVVGDPDLEDVGGSTPALGGQGGDPDGTPGDEFVEMTAGGVDVHPQLLRELEGPGPTGKDWSASRTSRCFRLNWRCSGNRSVAGRGAGSPVMWITLL